VATRVASPGVGVTVEPLVEEVEGLVGVHNVTVLAGVAGGEGGRGEGARGESRRRRALPQPRPLGLR